MFHNFSHCEDSDQRTASMPSLSSKKRGLFCGPEFRRSLSEGCRGSFGKVTREPALSLQSPSECRTHRNSRLKANRAAPRGRLPDSRHPVRTAKRKRRPRDCRTAARGHRGWAQALLASLRKNCSEPEWKKLGSEAEPQTEARR